VDVTVPPTVGARRAGVVAHRPVDGLRVRSILRSGIATTTPLRTLLELGAVGTADDVRRVLEHLLIAGTVTLGGTQSALERHARRGRDGVGALRSVLDEWTLGDRPPDSVLEAAMARLLARHGLPPPRFQHLITGPGFRYRVDFAYPEDRVVIEVDGWKHHGSRAAFEADRARDATLRTAGWTVLRFTWLQISRRPAWVAAQVATAIS
jgi:very-short-patch-repair endonuclease